MRQGKNCGPGRGYHHGNLREALIESALQLIAERGPAGFTFAEAARSAGVSPAAPYRHFRDRDDLMADVAAQGFTRFADTLEAAWNGGRPSPLTAFQNVGRAYLAFAKENPAYYAAMFETGMPHDSGAEPQQSAVRTFNILEAGAKALCETLAHEDRPPPAMIALHVWAMAHGIASLFGRGPRMPSQAAMPPEELLEAGVLVYLRGLRVLG